MTLRATAGSTRYVNSSRRRMRPRILLIEMLMSTI
jgi:hypothetical protein